MLKKLVASVLASAGILALNATPTLAERAVDFAKHKTIYPSDCSIVIEGEKYHCDYAVLGAFDDASGNIKLCSSQYCLIFNLTPSQITNVIDGDDFRVNTIAFQKGSSIVKRWNTSMVCGVNSNEMGCLGELANGTKIIVYLE